jgi:hypothetical protein
MNARQLAFLGSRLMAVYLLYQLLPEVFKIYQAFTYLSTNPEGITMGDFWMSFLTPILMSIGIYFLWDRAGWMSRKLTVKSDTEDDVPFTLQNGLQMGLCLIGVFMLTDALAHLAVFVYKWLPSAKFPYPDDQTNSELFYYGLMFVVNALMAFVLIGWPGNIARLILNLRRLSLKTPTKEI